MDWKKILRKKFLPWHWIIHSIVVSRRKWCHPERLRVSQRGSRAQIWRHMGRERGTKRLCPSFSHLCKWPRRCKSTPRLNTVSNPILEGLALIIWRLEKFEKQRLMEMKWLTNAIADMLLIQYCIPVKWTRKRLSMRPITMNHYKKKTLTKNTIQSC